MPADTVLVLVDQIKASGLSPQTYELVKALTGAVRPVVIAQSYLAPWRLARRLPFDHHFFRVTGEDWDEQMGVFSADLATRFTPSWALAVGWENATLAEALSMLDIPSVFFLDRPAPDEQAERSIIWAARHTGKIVLGIGNQTNLYSSFTDRLRASDLPAPLHASAIAKRRIHPALRKPSAGAIELAHRLNVIGTEMSVQSAKQASQYRRDAVTIAASRRFNVGLFQGHAAERDDAAGALDRYLRAANAVRSRPLNERSHRRPVEGFNPLAYASERHDYDDHCDEDPFAHYLRRGSPEGRWTHRIIRPSDPQAFASRAPKLSIALHAHMYYPELTPELIACLKCNRTRPDLFVTTGSEAARGEIAAALDQVDLHARKIVVVPNRGRDVWPFLDLLGRETFERYDVVGHLHGKKSVHATTGDNWRNFLWRHLIGGPEPMIDAVICAFGADPQLGIVFPEDPHICGWNANFEIATELARRAGFALPLPAAFEFPVGSMFWARHAALAPLLDLGLTKACMPEEPLAYDGTVLHAVERLLPFAAEKAGYTMAATHVPGSFRS